MELNDFVGNFKQVKTIIDWLTEHYHHPESSPPKHCIIYGPSGNGKSLLPKLLAKEFGVELFTITPLDGTNINDIIKSVNIKTLDGSSHKLILVDDIDEFPLRQRKELFRMVLISNHPIIYVTNTLILPDDFKAGSLRQSDKKFIKIDKPLTSELLEYLKTISKLPIETLDKIAKESKSVRSAILTLYNQSINTLTNPTKTRIEVLHSIKNRNLKKSLGKPRPPKFDDVVSIASVFKAIRGYDNDAFRVMLKFAEFDYLCNRTEPVFKPIEPYFVNNMIEPIDKVKLEHQYKGSNNKNKKFEKPSVIKKPELKKAPSINTWM